MRAHLFLVALGLGLAAGLATAGERPTPRAKFMQDIVCDTCSTKCASRCNNDVSRMCEDASESCRCFRRCTNSEDGKHLCPCKNGDGC